MYDLIYCNGDSFCAGMDLAEEHYNLAVDVKNKLGL